MLRSEGGEGAGGTPLHGLVEADSSVVDGVAWRLSRDVSKQDVNHPKRNPAAEPRLHLL